MNSRRQQRHQRNPQQSPRQQQTRLQRSLHPRLHPHGSSHRVGQGASSTALSRWVPCVRDRRAGGVGTPVGAAHPSLVQLVSPSVVLPSRITPGGCSRLVHSSLPGINHLHACSCSAACAQPRPLLNLRGACRARWTPQSEQTPPPASAPCPSSSRRGRMVQPARRLGAGGTTCSRLSSSRGSRKSSRMRSSRRSRSSQGRGERRGRGGGGASARAAGRSAAQDELAALRGRSADCTLRPGPVYILAYLFCKAYPALARAIQWCKSCLTPGAGLTDQESKPIGGWIQRKALGLDTLNDSLPSDLYLISPLLSPSHSQHPSLPNPPIPLPLPSS